jgi:DNA-binding MarR family transcriptional regulator
MLYLFEMSRPILGKRVDDFVCLESLVRNSYGEENKKATFPGDKIRRKEGEILKLIIRNSRFGISRKDLADSVRIDRKNLGQYIKRLTGRELITRAPGKHGRYFPSVNVYQSTILAASLFGEVAISKLDLEDASTERSALGEALLDFSNKIGAYITYILIQAMNPRNEHIIRSEEKDLDRDALVHEWTKNAILTIVPFLLGAFKDAIFLDLNSIKPSDLDPKKVDGVVEDYILKKPFYQMKAETIIELEQNFETIYPLLKYRFDEIMRGLPLATKNYQTAQSVRTDHFCMRQKVENSCKHEFRIAKGRSVLFDGSRYTVPNLDKILHCPKCHKTKFPRPEQ